MGNLKEMAMLTKQDWDWLATGSEYQMAVTIEQLLQENQVMEAREGLYALIESMGKSKKLALKSQCLNRDFIESIWDKCFEKAVKEAETEMNQKCSLISLSWQEVFEEKYSLFDYLIKYIKFGNFSTP
jgi:hypothetical protein